MGVGNALTGPFGEWEPVGECLRRFGWSWTRIEEVYYYIDFLIAQLSCLSEDVINEQTHTQPK